MAACARTSVLWAGVVIAFLACVAQGQLTQTSVEAFSRTLTGSVLAYNVSNEAKPSQPPTFDLWSYLEDGPNPYVKHSVPAVYVLAQDVNDILEALKFAAQNSLRSSIFSAGHQVVGVQLVPNGVTIDSRNLTGIDVDPDSQTALVQSGSSGQDLIDAIEAYNLMWSTGHIGSVGVAGIALGGGLGIGANLWGASVDSVLGIDVISTWQNNSADWEIVHINSTNYPDLFWGMLGGGPMLATAVAFELQLHPIPADGILTQAKAIWPIETAMEAFQWYYEWQQTTPIQLETEYALATVPGVGQVAAVSITNWDPENTTSVTEAFEAFLPQALAAGAAEAVLDEVTLTGYLDSYAAPGNLAYYINDRFLLSVPDELADSLITLFANSSGPDYDLLIAPSPNLVSKNNSDTAFGYRDTWYVWVWPFWARTAGGAAVDGDAEHIAWAAQGGEILDLYAEGHYLNMNRFDSADSTQTCFPPDNWARLQQVKTKYDPHNLFRPLDYYRTNDGFSGVAAN